MASSRSKPGVSARTLTESSGEQAHRRRVTAAIGLAGFTSFSLMYGTQPVLPQMAEHFALSPAQASLSVSAGTFAMALALIPMSLISDRFGRAPLMRMGLLVAVVFSVLSGLMSDYDWLLWCRLGVGFAVATVPAAGLAHLGDELAPVRRAKAIGVYIAANAVGGMAGRVVAALVTQWLHWRAGILAQGLMGMLAVWLFWRLLPPARHFVPRRPAPARLLRNLRCLLADPVLPWLFVLPFLTMGAFVGVYNYVGFLLSGPAFGWGPAAVGSLFLIYAVGSASSTWAGRQVLTHGGQTLMMRMCAVMIGGLLITLWPHAVWVIAGLAMFTFGFFVIHARASAAIAERAGIRRGLASALYLSSYYLGGSVVGSSVGWPWGHGGWPSVVVALTACMAAAWGTLKLAGFRR